MRLEEATGPYIPVTYLHLKQFREGVAFIPVEVLESYLDDLLEVENTDASLFIQKDAPKFPASYTSIFGIMSSMALGLYAASSGASMLASFLLTMILALPFGLLWHFSPKKSARRLSFAKVISFEVSRRRGGDKDKEGASLFEGFIPRHYRGGTQGAAFLLH